MSEPSAPTSQRSFSCRFCEKLIIIPEDLPPTVAPCPHCGESVTSPPLEVVKLAVPEKAEPVKESEQEDEAPKEEGAASKSPLPKWLLAVVTGVALCAILLLVLKMSKNSNDEEEAKQAETPSVTKEIVSEAYQERRWVAEAEKTLSRFLTAKTPEERAVETLSSVEEVRAFYQNYSFDETTTSLEGFGPVDLSQEDAKRGLYLMKYSRANQFTVDDFFRPIPPLRVKYGLEKPELILAGEGASPNASDRQVRVLAFFKKQEDGRLLLDWQTFVQSKYRLLREFVENASPGSEGVFRVSIREDVDLEGRDNGGFSVFRLSDPAHADDFAKVLVGNESELGQVLSEIRWRRGMRTKQAVRNATVKLIWSNEPEPKLQLGGLLCWQFLDLGGELGNWKKESIEGENISEGVAQ